MRSLIASIGLRERHRTAKQDFTRNYKLTFGRMLLIGLTRSVSALQLRLNETQRFLGGIASGFDGSAVTASAYSQARLKFSYRVFIELNTAAILPLFYADSDEEGDIQAQYWCGLRLSAIDGSDIVLPESPELLREYGGRKYVLNAGDDPAQRITKTRPGALLVARYDVLNNLMLDARLKRCYAHEGESALEMIRSFEAHDLAITDRGFSGYEYMATCIHLQKQFLTRVPSFMYKELQALARLAPDHSAIGTLRMPSRNGARMRQNGLPTTITVRCVLVMLSTGEEEVLISSLLDHQRYPTTQFMWLYGKRWGEETYLDRIKNRMSLEAFSGFTQESVLQDLWATLVVSNLETVILSDAQAILDRKPATNKYQQQVNLAASFSIVRQRAVELLLCDTTTDALLKEMTILFLQSPVMIRPGRSVPRKKLTPTEQARFLKYRRKVPS